MENLATNIRRTGGFLDMKVGGLRFDNFTDLSSGILTITVDAELWCELPDHPAFSSPRYTQENLTDFNQITYLAATLLCKAENVSFSLRIPLSTRTNTCRTSHSPRHHEKRREW